MPYPVIHITSHDPMRFSINLNDPKFGIQVKIEDFILSFKVEMTIVSSNPKFVSIVCVSTQEQFEEILNFVTIQDRNTVIVDSTDPRLFVMSCGGDDLVGFLKEKAPDPVITPDQVLHLSVGQIGTGLQDSTDRMLLQLRRDMVEAKTSSSRLQLQPEV